MKRTLPVIAKNLFYLAVLAFAVVFLFRGTALFSFFMPENTNPDFQATAVRGWKEFKSHALGVSVMYPPLYAVDSSYVYTPLNPEKGAKGVKFTVPAAQAEGTNLSPQDTGVSIEIFPDAKSCVAQEFVVEGLESKTLTDLGTHYSAARSTATTVGNFYEETVYAIQGSSPCTVVRYFIHSRRAGSYDAGSKKEFDRDVLVKEFDLIRRSLILTR